MWKFELGSKVLDRVTGFIGVIVTRTECLNGCLIYGVMPPYKSSEPFPEEIGIDEDNLILMQKKPEPKKKKKPLGGRYQKAIRRLY